MLEASNDLLAVPSLQSDGRHLSYVPRELQNLHMLRRRQDCLRKLVAERPLAAAQQGVEPMEVVEHRPAEGLWPLSLPSKSGVAIAAQLKDPAAFVS